MVSFTGVGLGAFAQESRLLGDQRIRRKLSDLQETQLRQQQQTAVRENINDLVGAAAGVAERAAEAGIDATPLIAPLRERAGVTADAGGVNRNEVEAMFDAATRFPGPAERGAATATESAAAGTGPVQKTLNFEMPDGTVQTVNARDQDAVAKAIGAGGVSVGLNVQAQTREGLGLGTDVKTEERKRAEQKVEAEELARDEALNLSKLQSLRRKLKELGPGVAGIRGIVGSVGGGLLGQLNESLGSGFSELITDASTEEVQSFRTEARAAVAAAVSQFTAEESGRITKEERAISQEALALLEPDASFPQIKAALEAATKLSYMNRDVRLFEAGVPFEFDLNTEEGILAQAEQLLSNGISDRVAAEIIRSLIDVRRELETVSGG